MINDNEISDLRSSSTDLMNLTA